MGKSPKAHRFWSKSKSAPTASRNLELVLTPGAHLPLPFWRERFLFSRARDEALLELTEGRFPARLQPGKTHPLFTLAPVAGGLGFRVCPCSSKAPRDPSQCRVIVQGCRLGHTGVVTDRDSHILHRLWFNIPREMCMRLSFQGQVPEACIDAERRRPIE